MADQIVALSMAAAVTKNLKLATGICLVPEHEPLALAKQFATLDAYSGGRVLFGIGAGWLREESDLFGVDFPHRWTETEEIVAAMRKLWTEDESSSDSQVRQVPAGEVAAEAGAEVGTAGADRQPRQERAQARGQVGRRMVPDCAEPGAIEDARR